MQTLTASALQIRRAHAQLFGNDPEFGKLTYEAMWARIARYYGNVATARLFVHGQSNNPDELED